ncbi:MAG TPA: hypothetical protein VJR50_02965, partial [Mycobacterium sp.]|nr:hypothetical protein [Mycobacterium sp.]
TPPPQLDHGQAKVNYYHRPEALLRPFEEDETNEPAPQPQAPEPLPDNDTHPKPGPPDPTQTPGGPEPPDGQAA